MCSNWGGLGPLTHGSHCARALGTRVPRRDRKPYAHTLFLDAAKGPATVMGGEYVRTTTRTRLWFRISGDSGIMINAS